jgi:hypothetical protein
MAGSDDGIVGEQVGGKTSSPYAPPTVDGRGAPGPAAPWAPLSWAAVVAFGAGSVASAVLALAGMVDASTGAMDGEDAVGMLVALAMMFGGVGVLGAVFLGLPVLAIWTGLAVKGYKDVTDDSVGWSPLMAGFGYFVCFLNFVVPHQVMTRLWERTTEYDTDDPMAATPAFIKAWWPVWIGAGMLSRVTSKMSPDFGPADALASAVFAVACALTAYVVFRMQKRLELVRPR